MQLVSCTNTHREVRFGKSLLKIQKLEYLENGT